MSHKAKVVQTRISTIFLAFVFSFQASAKTNCDLNLETPKFNDLYQYEKSLAEAMGLDGIRRPLIRGTGLCGPVCVVNAVASRFELPFPRALLVNDLVDEGVKNLNIPSPRIFSMTATWEVGRLLKSLLKKVNLNAKVDYLGDPVPSANPDGWDTSLPSYSEVRPTIDIQLKDLKTANLAKTIMIAMIKINKGVDRSRLTRASGEGHFVIIQKLIEDPKTLENFALIRDPASEIPYWAKLKLFKHKNFKFSSFELLPLEQTPETDKVIVPIVAIAQAYYE